ncbi:hypothetical protein [Streptomyces fulvoviolaceus]|uniref:hypothetical protein n=1 Tax=Streptomyces fulvoviolaceus TaxID=285535 RepID=UPI0004C4AC8A|nr:hypothetical protein [Streptomyces fulvoviolaceus]MCT9082292.1 hypothetical protein [Streptomyces fulvoviolaceus]
MSETPYGSEPGRRAPEGGPDRQAHGHEAGPSWAGRETGPGRQGGRNSEPDPGVRDTEPGSSGEEAVSRRRSRGSGAGREAGQRRRGGSRGPLRGVVGLVAAVLLVCGVGAGAWAVPGVRSVLKDSFTERQQAYIELYFGKEPFFDGDELVVPLEVVEHGDTGGKHKVRAWAEDAKGKRLAIGTETVTTKPGALIGVDVRLRLKGKGKSKADLVEVTLPGHEQRLRMHLR